MKMSAARDPHCEGCKCYITMGFGNDKTCDYILIEGHRRPCPPGKFCTVKDTGDKAKKRPPMIVKTKR